MRRESFPISAGLKAVLVSVVIVLCSCSSEPGPVKPADDSTTVPQTTSADPGQATAVSGPDMTTSGDRRFSNKPPIVQNARVKVLFENNVEVMRVFPEGTDPDGDPVTFVYEWTKNGGAAGTGDSVSGIKRGDQLSVRITPYDGRDYGQPKRLSTAVQNTNPRVLDVSTESFKDNVLTCLVKGFDPDGDPITYSLVDAPQGAAIDKESGLLTWPVKGDPKDPQSVKVRLTDGAGGELLYTLTVNITEEKVSVQPKAN